MTEESIRRRAAHRTLIRTTQRPGSRRMSYLFRINVNSFLIVTRDSPIRRSPARHNASRERPRERRREGYRTTCSIVLPGRICYWSRSRRFSRSSGHREVGSPLSDHDAPHPSHGSIRPRRVSERMSHVPWAHPFFRIALCSRISHLCSRTRTPATATNKAFRSTRRERGTAVTISLLFTM